MLLITFLPSAPLGEKGRRLSVPVVDSDDVRPELSVISAETSSRRAYGRALRALKKPLV